LKEESPTSGTDSEEAYAAYVERNTSKPETTVEAVEEKVLAK
jgi:hypothetical protein